MESTVRAVDVQNRMRGLSSLEITTTLIDSNPYLPMSDAYMVKLAARNNTTFDDLSTTDKFLANQIVVAMCCIKLVMSPPLPSIDAGPFKVKDIPADAKEKFVKELRNEIKDAVDMLEWTYWKAISGYSSSDDFVPDSEDRRNVLFTDEEETTTTLWD